MGLFNKKQETQENPKGERTAFQEKLIDALKMLRDAGILSDDEYHEKKAKVLDIN